MAVAGNLSNAFELLSNLIVNVSLYLWFTLNNDPAGFCTYPVTIPAVMVLGELELPSAYTSTYFPFDITSSSDVP